MIYCKHHIQQHVEKLVEYGWNPHSYVGVQINFHTVPREFGFIEFEISISTVSIVVHQPVSCTYNTCAVSRPVCLLRSFTWLPLLWSACGFAVNS